LFSISSNAYLEVQWYLFAAVFLLNAGNVLLKNAHVRIDVLTVRLRARVRLWIDLFGTLFFLMPFVVLMLHFSWPYFLTSFSQNEWSTNSGGLLVWPAKLLIVAGFALLLLQAIAQAIKLVAALMGRIIPDAALPPAVHNELGETPANGATASKQY
ncbi:MAG: TRAP transporter small permease subunit, partial [Thiotrichales bacterium]